MDEHENAAGLRLAFGGYLHVKLYERPFVVSRLVGSPVAFDGAVRVAVSLAASRIRRLRFPANAGLVWLAVGHLLRFSVEAVERSAR